MPDPKSPPLTLSDYLAMRPTSIVPQPYQKAFLAALQDGSRLETSSERWNRERNESLEKWSNAIHFYAIVGTEADADCLGRWLFWPKPAPTYFGRKRRARRARGRRRYAH